jgi:YebC/PmpR family DNA-binding regulatory protein
MSGHNKWSKIKRQKEITDKAKSATFAKLTRLITLSIIESGGIADPENNVRLRLAIEKARTLNMPKDNISRAIEKGSGPHKQDLKEVVYEAFGPSGAALMIVATTDNSNRTHAEVRTILERNGGKMGGQGAVSYLFQKCGVATLAAANNEEAAVFEFAEKIGAYDIEQDEEEFTVYFPFEHLGKVQEVSGGVTPGVVEHEYRPLTMVEMAPSNEQEVMTLIEKIEEIEDIQNVYSNVLFHTS